MNPLPNSCISSVHGYQDCFSCSAFPSVSLPALSFSSYPANLILLSFQSSELERRKKIF